MVLCLNKDWKGEKEAKDELSDVNYRESAEGEKKGRKKSIKEYYSKLIMELNCVKTKAGEKQKVDERNHERNWRETA